MFNTKNKEPGIPAWIAATEWGYPYIATVIGDAKDHPYTCDDDDNPLSVIIHFDGTLEELLQGQHERALYRARVWVRDPCDHDESKYDPSRNFFLTEEEAKEAVFNAGLGEDEDFDCIVCVPIVDSAKKGYTPVEFPYRVVLHQGNRGLYFRTQLRPDRDGFAPRQKMFFPDRSCKDKLCPGPALMKRITLDKGNFAFAEVEMCQVQAPSDDQIIEYVLMNSSYNAVIKRMSGKFGEYVTIDNHHLCLNKEGTLEHNLDLDLYASKVSTCTREDHAEDLVCQRYQNCDFHELAAKFKGINRVFRFPSEPEDIKFFSALVDKAIKTGFLSQRCVNNVRFFRISDSCLLHAVHQFSTEEMNELATLVNKTNAEADVQFQNLVKKGKIRVG